MKSNGILTQTSLPGRVVLRMDIPMRKDNTSRRKQKDKYP